MSDVVRLLESLVRAPSPSGEEEPAVRVLEAWLREHDLSPVRDGRNVWASVGEGTPCLLLCSHLDTVPVGDGWTRPPLDAHREGDRIYGRGANDAKASVAAMACALLALRRDGAAPPGRVLLAATVEEETGRPGGLPDLLPRLPRPDAAVVGEPTGLAPVIAQKGLLVLEATAHGRASHAARPEEGESAISNAADAIRALRDLRFERAHPVLGAPTAQVTVIQGGDRRNTIPARCGFWIDVRTTPAYEPRELADLISRAMAPHKVDIRIHSERIRAADVDPADPIVGAAAAATDGAATRGSPTVSDWAFLGGIPAVKLGPGESRRSHAPDEHVLVPELERGALVYARLARQWLARFKG